MGCPAVFLLGKGGRGDECHEMILEHGDVLIMDGQDRESLHAVPRVIPLECLDKKSSLQIENPVLLNYLTQARININLRQVSS